MVEMKPSKHVVGATNNSEERFDFIKEIFYDVFITYLLNFALLIKRKPTKMDTQQDLPQDQAEEQNIEKNKMNDNSGHPHSSCCSSGDRNKINLSLIMNFVLLAAVIFLFFRGKGDAAQRADMVAGEGGGVVDARIAFVNSDSLMSNYLLFDDLKASLERRQSEMENEMQSKASSFEREVNDFQTKVQSYAISSDQAQRMEADLMRKQQQLLDLRERMAEELMVLELNHQNTLFDSIISAITHFNTDYDFDYVLGYSKGSGILYANDKYDITPQIIGILNRNYN